MLIRRIKSQNSNVENNDFSQCSKIFKISTLFTPFATILPLLQYPYTPPFPSKIVIDIYYKLYVIVFTL